MGRRALYLLAGVLVVAVAAGAVLLVAFGGWGGRGAGGVTITYPLDGALFPPEIAAPTFHWTDSRDGADAWLIAVRFGDGGADLTSVSSARQWTPSEPQWEAIKRRSVAGEATVTIRGVRGGEPEEILSQDRVAFGTSPDEVGAPLFFREVNLPFMEAVTDPSHIRWRFGPVSSKQPPPVVLRKLPVCGNCHSFSADGKTLGMEVDSGNDKGAYAVLPVRTDMELGGENLISWSDYKRQDKDPTFGLLCQVSPDGRHVAGTVKDQALAVYRSDLMFSQIFFLIKGITAIYDRRTKTFAALPGADDRRFVQTNATWSPDGKHILFARAKAYDLDVFRKQRRALVGGEEAEKFLRTEAKTYLYDLYRVPFNGGNGGRAEPLKGGSGNGASNYFAKYSPDGKWVVFCKARSYMLLQPDSALHIVPAAGGEARRMRCNTHRLNSWHSWSPNGRWLVFSSKANGPYTQLWLTHVDEQGRDSPPVVLDRMTAPDRAANIPEFVNARPDAITRIHEQYLDDVSYLRAGHQFYDAGQYGQAARAFRKALTFNPKSEQAHYNLGLAVQAQGKLNEAMACYVKATELRGDFSEAYNNIGMLLGRQGRYAEARAYIAKAVKHKPDNVSAHSNLGTICAIEGDLPAAVRHFQKALAIEPRYVPAHKNLAKILLSLRNPKQAKAHLEKALAAHTRDPDVYATLASLLAAEGNVKAAIGQLEAAMRAGLRSPGVMRDLAWLLATSGQKDLRDGPRAVRLAQQACEATGGKQPLFLDALAAAHAEAGSFPEAVRQAEKALALARAAGSAGLAGQIQGRLALYKQGMPFRWK